MTQIKGTSEGWRGEAPAPLKLNEVLISRANRDLNCARSRGHCSFGLHIQGMHPSKDAFEDRLRHSGASRLSHFKGSFKCGREMQRSIPGFEGSTGWIHHGPTFIACWIFFLKWHQREEAVAAAKYIFNDKCCMVCLLKSRSWF